MRVVITSITDVIASATDSDWHERGIERGFFAPPLTASKCPNKFPYISPILPLVCILIGAADRSMLGEWDLSAACLWRGPRGLRGLALLPARLRALGALGRGHCLFLESDNWIHEQFRSGI